MTLNLLAQVPDGLVMLADGVVSASDTVDGELERISFPSARKLIHLGTRAPAAAMVNGVATVGTSTVSQLLREASRAVEALGRAADHASCIGAVTDAISSAYEERTGHPSTEDAELTVIVGSYFAAPAASTLTWPGAVRDDLATDTGSGLQWWGSGGESITRLIKGVDFGVLAARAFENDAHSRAALAYFLKNAGHFAMPLALEVMPVQQAVYFVEYLARVAAGFDRFKVGAHTVGGAMDVVALVDGELKWIHKQRLVSSFAGRGSLESD